MGCGMLTEESQPRPKIKTENFQVLEGVELSLAKTVESERQSQRTTKSILKELVKHTRHE